MCVEEVKHLYVDKATESLNSEGYSCSDISQLLAHGFDEFVRHSTTRVTSQPQNVLGLWRWSSMPQDTWYETEEVQEVMEGVTIRCGTIVRIRYGDGCDSFYYYNDQATCVVFI